MKIILTRAFRAEHYTLGIMQVEGVAHHPIFTMESPKRSATLASLIPEGAYLCKHHSLNGFPDCYEICDIPGRNTMLIHAGTVPLSTGGILIGIAAGMMNERMTLIHSNFAMSVITKIIGSNEFTLEIK